MKCVARGNGSVGINGGPGIRPTTLHWHHSAFTLLEVMIAGGVLFICLFAILALVSNGLHNAAILQHQRVDASMAAAELTVQFSTTNQVSEGSGSGDFGKAYPDYRYDWELRQAPNSTNGLCTLDIVVRSRSLDKKVESSLTTLLYLPNLQQNGSFGGTRR
jgi:hypothetical protein